MGCLKFYFGIGLVINKLKNWEYGLLICHTALDDVSSVLDGKLHNNDNSIYTVVIC